MGCFVIYVKQENVLNRTAKASK